MQDEYLAQRQQLEQAIAALEGQRPALGDAVVDASIAALRRQLAALDAAAPEEQRKLVTVLFADLAGWTQMASSMDPEDVQAIQQAYFQAVTAPIQQHGGSVEKYIGDAVLAVFGVPQAHEDDPERAVRAALAMQEALKRSHVGALARSDVLRIGIHTGLVVSRVDAEGDFVITGDTVNLASRLQAAAEPGTVLVSGETHKLAGHAFEAEVLPPLQVKGKAEPITAYRVLGPRARTWRADRRRVAGVQTALIGREEELGILQRAFQAVVEGSQVRVITVLGDAGVGKSRLLDEFEAWLLEMGQAQTTYKGRASATTQNMPYSVLRDIIACHCDLRTDDAAAAVQEKLERGLGRELGQDRQGQIKVHFIGQLLGYDFSASPHLQGALDDALQIRDRGLRYLTEFFSPSPGHGATLLFLEDLHWADDSSLHAVNYITQQVGDHGPLLVIALARPLLLRQQPGWSDDQPFHSLLHLQPLSKDSSRQLVAEILQRVDRMPEDLESFIVARGEGNPFYVEELIKMLVEDGIIATGPAGWRVHTERLGELRVPPTVTGVLQARLDGLPQPTRARLQQASVIGRTFWDQILASLEEAGIGEVQWDALPDDLQELRQREMVFPNEISTFAEAREYLFKHALLRDVTYDSLLKRLRRRYHGLVADWLLAHGGERARELTGLIADHLELGGRATEAVEYLEQASLQAAAQYANEEAIRYGRRALHLLQAEAEDDLLTPAQREAMVRIREHLGYIYVLVGRSEEAREMWEQALAQAPAEDRVGQARLQGNLADLDNLSFEKASQAYEKALTLLGPEPLEDSSGWWREWIDIQMARARLHYWRGDSQTMRARLDELRPYVETHGTLQQQAGLISELAMAQNTFDRFQLPAQRVSDARRSLALARQIGNLRRMASSQFGLGFTLLWHGDARAAVAELERALELAQEVGHALIQCRCLIYLAYGHRFLGDVERTQAYAQRTLELATASDIDLINLYLGPAKSHLAWVAWRRGNHEEAEALATSALQGAFYPFRWASRWPLLAMAVEQQQVEAGIDHARRMLDLSQQRLPDGQTVALEAAVAAWERGDRDAAQVQLARAVEEAKKSHHL